MQRDHVTRRVGLAGFALAALLLILAGTSSSASGYPAQYCARIPVVGGIPPWGFHTGSPITGASGSFARGHGDINLTANTVSGILCQVDRVRSQPDRLIIMTVEHHLVYHSHYAVMWGVPGNIMKIIVRVRSSTDPRCEVGTVGQLTLFASYNGVRSDSVQFSFPLCVQRPRPSLPRTAGRQSGPAVVGRLRAWRALPSSGDRRRSDLRPMIPRGGLAVPRCPHHPKRKEPRCGR